MSEKIFDKFVDSILDQYYKALKPLEEYAEYIIATSDYTIKDIVMVDADLGNNRQCKMVVCPSSCVVSGFGILPCDYFIGLEEIRDKQEHTLGWEIIHEVPNEFKTSWEEINSRKSCEICSHCKYEEDDEMLVCLKGHSVVDGVCEDWKLRMWNDE